MNPRLGAAVTGVLVAAGCGGAAASPTPAVPARPTAGVASCAAVRPARQAATARLAFVGRMLPGPSTPLARRRVLVSPARVRVLRYLKGSGPGAVKVTTAVMITHTGVTVAGEGIEPQAGEIWRIYTDSRHQPFDTSVCAGSSVIESAARVALELWSGFPVRARPRPIVPLGEGVVLAPGTGFPDGDTKLAYLDGRFRPRVALPDGRAKVGRFRVISAGDAYDRLHGAGRSRAINVRPLVVRAVHLGSAMFLTDRGRRRLPAWQFSFRRVARPASVLALAPPDLFRPPPRLHIGSAGTGNSSVDSAKANRSGTAITISFVGAPPGNAPCDARYSASAATNRRAVAFTIKTIAAPAPPGTVCAAVGYARSAVLRLARPLGGRVLISSSDGGAIPVTR